MNKRKIEQELKKMATESGASKFVSIKPADIVTANWVRLKCQFGCKNYGTKLTCPPYSPSPEDTRKVLDEYRQAFENRNVDALKAVQPGVDYEAMKKTFAEVTSYSVKIQIQSVTVEGTKATAIGVVTYSPVPKPAGKIQPVRTVFHLKKAADLWLIERLERK